jgi:hypothetical protein
MRQHDASAADPEVRRSFCNKPDHHFRTGAGETGSAVMLGQPIARVSEAIRRACKGKSITQGIARGQAFGNRGLVENAEANTTQWWPPPLEPRALPPAEPPPTAPPPVAGALRAPVEIGEELPAPAELGAPRRGAELDDIELGDWRTEVGPLDVLVKPVGLFEYMPGTKIEPTV